jgi:hypothetical protein
MAEVYVGRAPVDNVDEATRFVNKTIAYLSSNGDYLNDILLCGERTFFPGPIKFGMQSLLELIDGCETNGYGTVGIPSNLYNFDNLSDEGAQWDPSELTGRINEGRHVINHLGHNSFTMAMKLEFSDLEMLQNDDHFFVYSHGCFAGGFDTLECWAEYVTVKIDGGAFAAIMNGRLGWGSAWTTDSYSQRYNREFWDAVFDPNEDKPQLGRANQDSKEDNLYRIHEVGMRYVWYGLNLLGDPTVSIKRPRAVAFDFPNGIPPMIYAGEATTFQVNVSDLYGGVPVPGTGQLHFSINDGDHQTIAMSQIAPNQYEATLPAVDCGNDVEFNISIEETGGERIYDTSSDSLHTATAIIRIVIAFEDDFEADKGWNMECCQWQRGVPMGQGGQFGRPDPESGINGPNVMGYNLLGDYENDLPEVYLTSPVIDCSFLPNLHMSFERWLGLQKPPHDHAFVSISIDGANWTTIWENRELYIDSAWHKMEFDISEIASHQPTVYLRWTMGPTNEAFNYCGWNIDDVQVFGYDCLGYYCGDANRDDVINVADAVFLINYVFKGGQAPDPIDAGNVNCDATANVGDAVYLINYVFKGGPMPCADCQP